MHKSVYLDKIVRSAQNENVGIIDSDYVTKQFNHVKDILIEDYNQ